MEKLFIAFGIGVVAGIIDIVPMIIQKLDKFSCGSAFIHWVVLGLIIPYVVWNISPWLKGLIIAELSAIPIMILVYPQNSRAVVPIFIFSAILGAGIGLAGARYIG